VSDEVLDPGDQLLPLRGQPAARTLEKQPRWIARWVMIPKQRSTWFSQEA
jgi:hypothetical protein